MNKLKQKSKLIVDNVYKRHTLVIVGDNLEYAVNTFKNTFKIEPPQFLIDLYTKDISLARTVFKTNVAAILFREKTPLSIAHEAFHATEYHLDCIGLNYCDATSEAWAYYIGFLVEEISNLK